MKSTLSDTFIPKSLIKKTEFSNTNPILQKNTFEKTHGNIYVELDPPQIKFNGYELNKLCTATFKIVNKASIPQRFTILPPTQPQFSIKVHKKGAIPTGMYETVQVQFIASQYKYTYDIVKICTQTENFVLPVYAYPSIPNIDSVFPKLIDFGNVQLKQSESNLYPIQNTTPIQYAFDFQYVTQCNQIIITPLSGTIPSNGQTIIQITFIPSRKVTYSAEVYFKIQQFDFQPKLIRLIGNGKQKQMGKSTFKRLKSSKLTPINATQRASEKDKMNQTDTFANQKNLSQSSAVKDATINNAKTKFVKSIKKSTVRSSYPKLLNSTMKPKATNGPNQETIKATARTNANAADQKSSQDRLFLNRFNRVQQLDKEKQIRFAQYLGDRAMSQQQINDQKQIVSQMKKFRDNLAQTKSQTRYNPEKSQMAQVEFSKLKSHQLSWNQNRNDDLYERRTILSKFVKAASSIIQVRRMKKRLEKIKVFLNGCTTQQEVAKKVGISYAKSLQSQSTNAYSGQIDLNFDISNIFPTFMQLQFSKGQEKLNTRIFQTEGKTQFDDLQPIDMIEPFQPQRLNYKNATFPSDFVNLSKIIPQTRISGQEQFSVKSSSLPSIQPVQINKIVSKPIDVPNHFFIYDAESSVKMKKYNTVDQKDTLFVLSSKNQPIQDELQGWSKGDFQVLKHKLMKNTGVNYAGLSKHTFSSLKNDIGFLGDITKNIPKFIQQPKFDDTLQDNDSDQEQYQDSAIETAQDFMKKIQVQPEVKERRQKAEIKNQIKALKDLIDTNIGIDKRNQAFTYASKIRQVNKYIKNSQNYLLP